MKDIGSFDGEKVGQMEENNSKVPNFLSSFLKEMVHSDNQDKNNKPVDDKSKKILKMMPDYIKNSNSSLFQSSNQNQERSGNRYIK